MGQAADELMAGTKQRRQSTRELLRDRVNPNLVELTEEEKKKQKDRDVTGTKTIGGARG